MSTRGTTGTLLVPYYEHPLIRPAEWEAVLAAAPRLHGVVLNPASGPGDHPDPAFAALAERLRTAGVRVLGYADTAYGARPHHQVVRDIQRHRDWYGADGVFFDQTASGPDGFPHYQALASAAWAAGCAHLVLNPGVPPHPWYGRIADVLVTFEGTWDTYRGLPPTAWAGTPTRQCHLVYGVPAEAGDTVAELARARGAAVHCAVPGGGRHPWGTLPYGLSSLPSPVRPAP
ncbi:spherulation-specific family 4 protein [Streptomyces cavernae]|uniref:spherulation-specific family 4 protein n=1 Tax=Streptomyces cavernae TaxID=2259034 RepID=UPI000FEBEA4D|nr:spherulation-specific family 4 protein [Streptomyces cavernae]